MAAIAKMDRSVYDYIHSYYKRPAYDSTYAKYICPMSSSELWPKTADKPIKPPPCKKRTGRPKTNRIKEPGELPKNATKLPRYDHVIHCSICGVEGHNQRSCSQVSQGNLLFVYALIKLRLLNYFIFLCMDREELMMVRLAAQMQPEGDKEECL
jgi:hypothetical protein